MRPQLQRKLATPLLLIILGLGVNQILRSTAQTPINPTPKPTPQEIIQAGEVRFLPGKLNTIPVFNSNSPD